MLESLRIKNFKCFNDEKFNFSKLNLLTGINGRGKSSLIQAILLLAQSCSDDNSALFRRLNINGNLIKLGCFNDIKNRFTPKNMPLFFEIVIKSGEDESAKVVLEYTECSEFSDGILKDDNNDRGHIDLFGELQGVCYISADRSGPVKYFDKYEYAQNDFLVNPQGTNVLNIISRQELSLSDEVHDYLYRGNDAKSLFQQIQEWMSYIMNGFSFELKGKESDSSTLYLRMANTGNPEKFSPVNMGFGYSYILPIVVAGLSKPKYSRVLIVENPEAHLHPQAQSRMAEFLAIVASTGIQVFVETHSEHILNGCRIACLKEDIKIGVDDFIIQYFNEDFTRNEIKLEKNGKIKEWPSGFFDQQGIDLAELYKLSRITNEIKS